ncbi:MAG: dTMP kinase [Candidatus Spechtbacteria bacterium RIFCSPHIGHO2_02_FULL_43_15b]|uniref:Thymidylate kinase n=1 Tax=Candidatus Spechtbacteria bacterium RIFCSPHIGHO2_01_FULL_43_30 TaxID=1802158 RepID=A0A1G2H840_9BACT|nr:MAG: dTMP kinase [Candidatus Spechtbacteria bacterium RIFCSPHIGHO2_01_FULL_43_30]OGZ59120.1 MAG: dTMP kinase [Candidatus Spechtbacteria bacterium RIFCSPHIGHO2_02_FULL_43_15b]
MKKNSYPGKFIAFEGLDGSGQSTQVERLAKHLRRIYKDLPNKPSVYATKEPSTGVFGGFIREGLRERWRYGQIHGPLMMQALFVADRAHHLENEIIPNLIKGNTVITDRYAFSTIAYGAAEDRELWDCLIAMNKTFLEPDITVFLKARPESSMNRMKKSREHLELYEKEAMLKRVFSNYVKLSQIYKSFRTVNGECSISEVSREIRAVIEKEFDLKQ